MMMKVGGMGVQNSQSATTWESPFQILQIAMSTTWHDRKKMVSFEKIKKADLNPVAKTN